MKTAVLGVAGRRTPGEKHGETDVQREQPRAAGVPYSELGRRDHRVQGGEQRFRHRQDRSLRLSIEQRSEPLRRAVGVARVRGQEQNEGSRRHGLPDGSGSSRRSQKADQRRHRPQHDVSEHPSGGPRERARRDVRDPCRPEGHADCLEGALVRPRRREPHQSFHRQARRDSRSGASA